jgi:hypothetical protein
MEEPARRACLASDLGNNRNRHPREKYLGLKTFFNRTIGTALIVEIHGKPDRGDAARGRRC